MRAQVFAWAALAALPSGGWSQDATLILLDGSQVSGRLVEVSDNAIVLNGRAGNAVYPLASTHWLRIEQHGAPDQAKGMVELIDGSILPIEQLLVKQDSLDVELAEGFSAAEPGPLTLSYEHAAAFVFQRGGSALQDQWRRIRETDATADLVVVKRRDGETLDFVEGIVTAVQEDSLTLLLDGETLEVARARVYGVVCFRPDAPDHSPPGVIRVGVQGGALRAKRVDWDGESDVVVDLAGVGPLRFPVEKLDRIDYSRGRVVMLGSLTPIAVNWEPLFHPPGDFDLVEPWGLMRVDHSYSGDPISLVDGSGKRRAYASGVAIRSLGRAVFEVPNGFAYFRATLGIDPASLRDAGVVLRIEGDGQVLYDKPIFSGEPPHELELPIASVRQLSIVVEYGRGTDSGDNLHLANARFTK